MHKPFAPSLRHFQKDIERYLKSEGKCETNERGQTVYRGYEAAVGQMFRAYTAKEAFVRSAAASTILTSAALMVRGRFCVTQESHVRHHE